LFFFGYEGSIGFLDMILEMFALKKCPWTGILGIAWQRPTLPGAKPQVPSALESLTFVFGMGTSVTSPPSSPDIYAVDTYNRHLYDFILENNNRNQFKNWITITRSTGITSLFEVKPSID
jgi:hypothetical protein